MKLTYCAQLPRGGETNVNIFVFQFVNKHRNGHHIRGRLIHRHAVGLKEVQQVTQQPLQFALRAISSSELTRLRRRHTHGSILARPAPTVATL